MALVKIAASAMGGVMAGVVVVGVVSAAGWGAVGITSPGANAVIVALTSVGKAFPLSIITFAVYTPGEE